MSVHFRSSFVEVLPRYFAICQGIGAHVPGVAGRLQGSPRRSGAAEAAEIRGGGSLTRAAGTCALGPPSNEQGRSVRNRRTAFLRALLALTVLSGCGSAGHSSKSSPTPAGTSGVKYTPL